MARTAYATGNNSGHEVGPSLVADDTEISALEVREQHGFGIIDARLHFRNEDGSSIPGNPQTDWLTDNDAANYTGAVILEQDELFTGLYVQVQHGFGIVNLRIKKSKRDGTPAGFSDFVVNNGNASAFHEIDIPTGAVAKGIIAFEQAGFGLVDIAIDYEQ
jgi:hypothetical protein